MNLLTLMFLKKTLTPKKTKTPTKSVPLPQVKRYTVEEFIMDRNFRPWKVGKLK